VFVGSDVPTLILSLAEAPDRASGRVRQLFRKRHGLADTGSVRLLSSSRPALTRFGKGSAKTIAASLFLGAFISGFVTSPLSAATKSTTQNKKKKPTTTRKAVVSPTTIAAPKGTEAYKVTARTLQLVDSTRPTAATTKSAATTSRKLPTLVLTPEGKKKFPLLVFSHGLGGEPSLYEPLLQAMAARGYVVAAPTFPLTSRNAPGGPNIIDQPNQPKDVSFVITEMLKDAAVDPEKVIAAGHSLGAITTIDLFGNETLRDKRIDAAIVVAGTVNVFSFAKMFTGTATPVLFLHGELDATVPYDLGFGTYETAKPPKWFITVVGGDHSFGIAQQPAKLAATGAVYVDAMMKFADAQMISTKPADTTAALRQVVSANPGLLRLDSATN
jgi:fermentation-respiration switch protein FrsA (DUF1100 family)